MSSPAADQDHSIEEILASIRQIISEDDQKSGAESITAVVPPDDSDKHGPVDLALPTEPVEAPYDIPADPMPAHADEVLHTTTPLTEDEDVFELVDRVDEPAPELPSSGLPPSVPVQDMSFDLPPLPPVAPSEPETSPAVRPEPALGNFPAPSASDQIFTDVATSATLGAFAKLSETILMERKRAIEGASITLDDIVKDLLRPLLRTWIDQNMPGIVDRLVREELEKITRQARER